MSRKRERSNHDPEESRRQKQNADGQGPTRRSHASSNADKVPGKSAKGDRAENRENHRQG